jgi:predicted metal-dependent hydrolase
LHKNKEKFLQGKIFIENKMDPIFDWQPPFVLRQSARARNVRLQMCPQKGFILTIPKKFNQKEVPEILQKHRAWIEKQWARIQSSFLKEKEDVLPVQFNLLALHEVWQIHYEHAESNTLTCKMIDGALVLRGKTQDSNLVKKILNRWLVQYAKLKLLPWLKRLSVEKGFDYARASIRSNQSRWGSCTVKKNIILNCKLLFLPAAIAEHVMLHELCHTVQLNHSEKFWNLLRRVDPHCDQLRQQLRKANDFVPNI